MSILPYLETFAAVVDKGSFTAAAKALDISKPVVSKQISHLEKTLGVQLLHRTTRRLRLTEAGEVFARYSQRIVAEAWEAEQSVLPLQSEPRGRLRISAPESLAMSLLPEALLEFQQRFPRVRRPIPGFSRTRTERISWSRSQAISARTPENCYWGLRWMDGAY